MLQHLARGTAVQAQKLATRSDFSSDLGIGTSLKDGGGKNAKSQSLTRYHMWASVLLPRHAIRSSLPFCQLSDSTLLVSGGRDKTRKPGDNYLGPCMVQRGPKMEMVCQVLGSPNGT